MGYELTRIRGDGDEETTDVGPPYFDCSVLGMAKVVRVLEWLGMGFWADVPPLPDDPEEYRRATFSDKPGIALHKFTSNSGWIVTKAECESAVELWDRLPADTVDEAFDLLLPPEHPSPMLTQLRAYLPERLYRQATARLNFVDDSLPFLRACAHWEGMRVT
jgi:hypothetical protein